MPFVSGLLLLLLSQLLLGQLLLLQLLLLLGLLLLLLELLLLHGSLPLKRARHRGKYSGERNGYTRQKLMGLQEQLAPTELRAPRAHAGHTGVSKNNARAHRFRHMTQTCKNGNKRTKAQPFRYRCRFRSPITKRGPSSTKKRG